MLTDEGRVFSVSPLMTDVPPQKSASFQVAFKPVSNLSLYVLTSTSSALLFGWHRNPVVRSSQKFCSRTSERGKAKTDPDSRGKRRYIFNFICHFWQREKKQEIHIHTYNGVGDVVADTLTVSVTDLFAVMSRYCLPVSHVFVTHLLLLRLLLTITWIVSSEEHSFLSFPHYWFSYT